MSEVLNGIDQSIQKKEQEQNQILAIRDAMYKVIELDDALKGEGGNAIKEYFKVLHIPILLLLDQFLEQYIQNLKAVRNKVQHYEAEDGMIREDFITSEVKHGLDKAQQATHDTVGTINDRFMEVSDLIGRSPVSTTPFDEQMDSARSHNQKTIDDLRSIDQDSTSKLNEPANDLQTIQQFVGKTQEWSNSGIFLSPEEIQELENYFLGSKAVQKMIDDAIELSMKQGRLILVLL